MECIHTNVGQEIKHRIINKRHNIWTQDSSKANFNSSVSNLLTTTQQRRPIELTLFATSSHGNTNKGNEMQFFHVLLAQRKIGKIFQIHPVVFTIAEIQTQLCIQLPEVLTASQKSSGGSKSTVLHTAHRSEINSTYCTKNAKAKPNKSTL